MALQNKVKCRCYNETNNLTLLIQKHNKNKEQGKLSLLQWNKQSHPINSKTIKNNIMINFVLRQIRLILFNANFITKNNISFVKNVSKL